MYESVKRFGLLADAKSSCFIGILFSCLTGVLLVGIPLQLVANKLLVGQQIFVFQFISWLLIFSGGALFAAAGAWSGYLVTSGHQPVRFRSIVAASEVTAIALAIAAALMFSLFPKVLGESLYGVAQPETILFFAGVLVIASSASLAAWRFREGVASSIATTARLFVLGALVEAALAMAVYLVFSLVPTL